MRTLSSFFKLSAYALVPVTTLALALASGSAEARFVVYFDDPTTQGVDYEIVDQECPGLTDPECDQAALEGVISVLISDPDGLEVTATAVSRMDRGAPTLLLGIGALSYLGDLLEVSVTDTDFTVTELTEGTASVLAGKINPGNLYQFDFFGDPGNGEFVEGFTLTTFGPGELFDFNYQRDVTSAPVGSLTLSADFDRGTAPLEIVALYTQVLQIGEPRPGEGDCGGEAGNIIGETVDRVTVVGDGCTLQDSVVESGDVSANGFGNFTMTGTEVRSGDVDLKNVATAVVSTNNITNGKIKVAGGSAIIVVRNTVDGSISVENSAGVAINDNVANGNIEAQFNQAGTTRVNRNTTQGRSDITVSNNAFAIVNDNSAAGDIECRNNDQLEAARNRADRRNQCR